MKQVKWLGAGILVVVVDACATTVIVDSPGFGGGGEPTTTGTGGTTTHTGGGPTTSSSTGKTSTSSTSSSGPANLGASCMVSSDCTGGLACAPPAGNDAVFGGGPAGGYCTTFCTSDSDCPSGGACLLKGSAGRCVLTCTQGPQLMHINDPISDQTKCLARPDVACTQIGQSQPECLPLCGSDSQCPAGMHCDPRTSVCVTAPSTGLAMGRPCAAADGGADPCAGNCLSLDLGADGGTDPISVCSESCEMGVDPSASAPTVWTACGGIKNGLCLYSAPGQGAGDQGFCANACSKQDDCANPYFFCYAIINLTGTSGITNGWCFPATPCVTNADCSIGTCVATAYGNQCLSAQFPLGSAAPDGG